MKRNFLSWKRSKFQQHMLWIRKKGGRIEDGSDRAESREEWTRGWLWILVFAKPVQIKHFELDWFCHSEYVIKRRGFYSNALNFLCREIHDCKLVFTKPARAKYNFFDLDWFYEREYCFTETSFLWNVQNFLVFFRIKGHLGRLPICEVDWFRAAAD